jgi:hypothetical protein
MLPRLQQMYDGWRKEDPPTTKQLPIEADIPEYLANLGRVRGSTALDRAIGDLVLIAFYYLLRIGEYTIKGTHNNMKQTVRFKLEDVPFFKKDTNGALHCLPCNAPDSWTIRRTDGKGSACIRNATGTPIAVQYARWGAGSRIYKIMGRGQKHSSSLFWEEHRAHGCHCRTY